MKKQLFTSLLVLISATTAVAAASPVIIGNVRFQDELVIINDSVVCLAYSAPADDIRPETISHGTVNFVYHKENTNSFSLSGNLDGDLMSIHNTENNNIVLSLQEAPKKSGEAPAYAFSADGKLTEASAPSIGVITKGRYKSIHCGIHKQKK